MSTSRCPECGGLVTADAEWCGQCGARFDRPRPAAPPTPEEQAAPAPSPSDRSPSAVEAQPRPGTAQPGSFRRSGERVLWTCPVCGEENPLDATACEKCGTPFRQLFEDEAGPAPRLTSPALVTGLSLVLPGAGHVAAGRVGEGVARAIMFLWVLGSAIAMLVVGNAPRSFSVLALVYLLAAAVLYGGTALDASRSAQARGPVLSGRVLLYLAGGLILLTIAVVLISGLRIAR